MSTHFIEKYYLTKKEHATPPIWSLLGPIQGSRIIGKQHHNIFCASKFCCNYSLIE